MELGILPRALNNLHSTACLCCDALRFCKNLVFKQSYKNCSYFIEVQNLHDKSFLYLWSAVLLPTLGFVPFCELLHSRKSTSHGAQFYLRYNFSFKRSRSNGLIVKVRVSSHYLCLEEIFVHNGNSILCVITGVLCLHLRSACWTAPWTCHPATSSSNLTGLRASQDTLDTHYTPENNQLWIH